MTSRKQVLHRIERILGQNSGYNPDSIPKEKAQLLYNFYVQNGIAKKIPGSTLYMHTAYGSSPIKWMSDYQKRLVFQIGTNVIIEPTAGSQTEELLASDFDTDRIFSDKWRDRIYLANGKQLRYYDGSSVKELGLPPPGMGITPRNMFTGANGGLGTLPAGTYKYTVTFFDDNSQTESLPIGALIDEGGLFPTSEFDADVNPLGWITLSIVTAINTENVLQFSADFRAWLTTYTPARATQMRLYRSVDTGSGFGDYRLVTSFSNSGGIFNFGATNSYSDNTAQASLGEILITDDKIPPPQRAFAINSGAPDTTETTGPKFIRFWRDSLFVFGFGFPTFTVTDTFKGITNLNNVTKSALYGSDTGLPDYFLFSWEVGAGDDTEPTGVAVINDTFCMFKERSIYTLEGTSLNNFVAKVQDPTRGCIAPGSIQETPFGIIFLSDAGIGRFKGTGAAEIISNEILDEILLLNQSALSGVTSAYDRLNEVYTIFVPRGTDTSNTRQFQLSMKDAAWTVGRRRHEISSMHIVQSASGPRTLLGSTFAGNILDISDREISTEYGAASEIRALWRSSDFDFGDREKQKRLTWLYIKAACHVNWIVSIAIYADDGQGPVFELASVDSESDITRYSSSQTDSDGAVYDQDRYQGPQTIKKLKIPISGIGRSFYVEILEEETNAERHSFDLMSIEVEGTQLDH